MEIHCTLFSEFSFGLQNCREKEKTVRNLYLRDTWQNELAPRLQEINKENYKNLMYD